MSQSFASILIHIVFSTKKRKSLIKEEIAEHLHNYITGIAQNLKAPIYEIGSVEDHIHLLINLPRTMTLSQLVEELKKNSSKWIKTQGEEYLGFSWQKGYGAFSIGYNDIEWVRQYIQNQREHHKKLSFEDELRLLLDRYQIAYDEQYLWE